MYHQLSPDERLRYYEDQLETYRAREAERFQRRLRWQTRFRMCAAAMTPLGVWLLLAYVVFMNMCGCAATHPVAVMTPPPPPGRSEAAQERAAVDVEVYCFYGEPPSLDVSYQRGSGVLVSNRDVITANHVVHCTDHPGGAALVRVMVPSGERVAAETVVIDFVHDLARIVLAEPVDGVDHPHVMPPRKDSRVCIAAAYPHRGRQCGQVLSIVNDGTASGEIRHTAPTFGGNSGSGVYDETGYLVGIVDSRPLHCNIPDIIAREGFSCGGRAALLAGRGVMP